MFSSNTSQVSDDKLFVEDCFSCFLYQGNGSTQTITNGIDLAGKGGLVWIKARSSAQNNVLADTANGTSLWLSSNTADGQSGGSVVTSFSSTGFNTGGNTNYVAGNGVTYASWTFRKAPKFFDVVTYTGNGVSGRTVAHSLGVAPGTIIVKRTDVGAGWRVYHRSQPNGYGDISSSDAFYTASAERVFGNGSTVVAPSSTDFTIGDVFSINGSGGTYVAYLFAHDTTSDGIIQCGSYTGNGSTNGPTVNLGWEPQWLLFKRADSVSAWYVIDNMRGMALTGNGNSLYPNLSGAENSHWSANFANINSTGFKIVDTDGDINASGGTYIYIAIRRGPMRTPTSGTSVFAPVTYTGNQTARTITSGFPIDLHINSVTNQSSERVFVNRLAGVRNLTSTSTAAEGGTYSSYLGYDNNTGVNYKDATIWTYYNENSQPYSSWFFRRAPSFFDVVCYAGVNATLTLNHNLGVAPELIIVKNRTSAGTAWPAWASPFSGTNDSLYLNTTAAKSATGLFTTTPPTSTTFTAGNDSWINASGSNYVAYLFASCPGVSKVFSFTGNGSSQTINCGFSGGARFVMIKRTDSTGDWWVWDTARGIVSANDPALRLNSTAAETTGIDSIDPDSSGFIVNQDATTNINVNGASYIGLAVA